LLSQRIGTNSIVGIQYRSSERVQSYFYASTVDDPGGGLLGRLNLTIEPIAGEEDKAQRDKKRSARACLSAQVEAI
jgi:hypothetical protein